MLKTSPILLSDDEIRVLLKMYWVSDITKVTGLPSAALRMFVSGHTGTLKSTNARILSDFLWTHHQMTCRAFGIDSDNISAQCLLKKAQDGSTIDGTVANFLYENRIRRNGVDIINRAKKTARKTKAPTSIV